MRAFLYKKMIEQGRTPKAFLYKRYISKIKYNLLDKGVIV